MCAPLTEFPAPFLIQSESDYHRTLRDLTVATVALELVADCGDVPAELRRVAEAAYLRLFDAAERLQQQQRGEAGDRTVTPSPSAVH